MHATVWQDDTSAMDQRNQQKEDQQTNHRLRTMRVLFVSALNPDYYGAFRLATLHRLGLERVVALDEQLFAGRGLAGKLQFRTQLGPGVSRFNHEVLRLVRENRVNVAWFDKALGLWPQTLRALREMGVFTIDYVNDNCFGPRRDPGWRLYRKTVPEFDLHAVPRDVSLRDYQQHGARSVTRIRFTYEPTIHFPPPSPIAEESRTREVSFIGTPYDDRAQVLTELWRNGAPLAVSGSEPHWRRALTADAFASIFRDGELKGAAYREAIWHSRINLAFVTKANRDGVAHKSFEIAACGGFLLAERTPEHLQCFREDQEAVFFSSVEEASEKIKLYLADSSARARIAAAGRARAVASGYDNDSMMRAILESVELRRSRK